MTNRDLSTSDIIWSYAAQLMNLTAGIVTLPILLFFLGAEEIKIWIVFITLGSLALLFEFGFQPTLSRNIAYVFSGSKALYSKGLASNRKFDTQFDEELLYSLLNAGRSIYLRISFMLAVVFIPLSTFYLYSISNAEMFWGSILLAWALFSFGLVVNFYFGYMTSMLFGASEVAKANKVTVLTRCSFIIISVVCVISGFGILSIGIANFSACILGRLFALYYVRQIEIYKFAFTAKAATVAKIAETRRTVSTNAYKLGATQLGAFAIQRGSILIAAAALPDTEATAYAITMTILMALFGISLAAPQAMLPHQGRAAQTEDNMKSERLLGRSILMAQFTYISGFIVFLLLSFYVSTVPFVEVTLLSTSMLLVLGVILFLEVNHAAFAMFITASNQVPFYKSSLICGFCILLMSSLTVGNYGLWALILVQGFVQLSYNNWKWPQMALKSQNSTYRKLLCSEYENLIIAWKGGRNG